MHLVKLRISIEKKLKTSDAHPMVISTLLSAIAQGLRQSTENPPDDGGSTEWEQDKFALAFAEKLEQVKLQYNIDIMKNHIWRNRAGLPRKRDKK